MKFLYCCVCISAVAKLVVSAPANGFVFPKEHRHDKKLEPIITPPILPILEHLERDPSTLLPSDAAPSFKHGLKNGPGKNRFGFGSGFSVAPSGNGGLTASVSSSSNGAGASHSASQSFSFGFNEGFSASHAASQSSSFSSNGFGNSGFSGSQASSQAGSFQGSGVSGAASSSSALAGGGQSGSQSASSAFGFNSQNGFQPSYESSDGTDLLDIRHRGAPGSFVFPGPYTKGVSAAAGKVTRNRPSSGRRGGSEDWLAILVSD